MPRQYYWAGYHAAFVPIVAPGQRAPHFIDVPDTVCRIIADPGLRSRIHTLEMRRDSGATMLLAVPRVSDDSESDRELLTSHIAQITAVAPPAQRHRFGMSELWPGLRTLALGGNSHTALDACARLLTHPVSRHIYALCVSINHVPEATVVVPRKSDDERSDLMAFEKLLLTLWRGENAQALL